MNEPRSTPRQLGSNDESYRCRVMRIRLLWCMLVVLAGHAVSAQEKPDFSGEWIW